MLNVLMEFKSLPRFPDGRINYSKSERAPVINCFVKYKDKVLILKRSNKVLAYKGKWNSVGGYIDENKPVKEKAIEELEEELKISRKTISRIKVGIPYEVRDESIKRTWIVFPVLAELNKAPKIMLDFEHTDFKWINPKDLLNYDIVPGLEQVLKKLEK